MELQKVTFPKTRCTRAEAQRWLKEEFGASVMTVPDSPGNYYPPHSHACHEIIVGIAGRIHFQAEGQEFPVRAGEVLYLPEGTVHSAKVASEGCEYLIGHSFQ